MTEYIEKQAAIDALGEEPEIWCETDEETATRNQWERDKVAIESVQPADVRPVVRGRWEVSRTDYDWNGVEFPTHCKCSECGKEVPYQDKDNFCPRCSADLREGDDG